jgi:nucleotide-binding universal stress UspA family protein
MYNRILVPTDGSAASRAAAREAIELAGEFGATIYVVYVVDESISNLLFTTSSMDKALEAMSEVGRQATAEIEELAADASIPVEVETIRGMQVSEAIIEYATGHDVDLIVMGTSGRRGVEHVVGSTTERVLERSPIPVLSVTVADEDT